MSFNALPGGPGFAAEDCRPSRTEPGGPADLRPGSGASVLRDASVSALASTRTSCSVHLGVLGRVEGLTHHTVVPGHRLCRRRDYERCRTLRSHLSTRCQKRNRVPQRHHRPVRHRRYRAAQSQHHGHPERLTRADERGSLVCRATPFRSGQARGPRPPTPRVTRPVPIA